MRKRWENFCDQIVLEAGKNGGEITPQVVDAAMQRSFAPGRKGRSNKYLGGNRLKHGLDLLKLPDIQRRIGLIFEDQGDFSVTDAVKMHVDHIKGNIQREVVTKGGDVVKVNVPPSLPALMAYEKMVLPQPAAEFRGKVAHLHADAGKIGAVVELPAIEGRVLSATIQAAEDLRDRDDSTAGYLEAAQTSGQADAAEH